jgi:uncharacterized DUF497 family protein
MKKEIIIRTDKNGEYHFKEHDVTVEEIHELFNLKKFISEKRQNKKIAIYGKLKSGRYLKLIYKKEANTRIVITVFDIEDEMIKQAIDAYIDDY